ncbi:hypothetical protein SMC26_01285 [Actinomadura fulvescens]|uniref:Uncharacterized protein n=1 Tax=Actinomadura fulvescens TaxID=46160 RepID=A0ABN3QCF7_9ACTN
MSLVIVLVVVLVELGIGLREAGLLAVCAGLAATELAALLSAAVGRLPRLVLSRR